MPSQEELEAAKREICVTQMREKRLTEQFKLLQNERKMEREEVGQQKFKCVLAFEFQELYLYGEFVISK